MVRGSAYNAILVGCCLVATTACANEPTLDNTPIKAKDLTTVTTSSPQVPAYLEAAVAQAREQLVAELGHSQIKVVKAIQVTWSDRSAGCAMPGYQYAQVLSPGYWLTFEAKGSQYHFTGLTGTAPRLCPKQNLRPPSRGSQPHPDA